MENIKQTIISQKTYFTTGETLTYHYRIDKLRKLNSALYTYEKPIFDALKQDLGKTYAESYMSEVALVKHEIKYLIKNMKNFMKTKKVKTPLFNFPSKSYITNEPLGTVLIMSPWNYPIYLTLAPLAAAIAGGNTVIIKPSRYSENTSKIILKMINSIYSQDYVSVVLGGSEVNQELLNYKFDLIFFTGSPKVGKIVMKRAAEHLTPVILELGGKSPVYVDSSANIKITASRLVWGKFLNVGQTCVAPDYVLCHEKVYKKLLLAVKEEIIKLYGDNPLFNEEYGKIINKKHFNRLAHLLDDGILSYGGYVDPDSLKISPAIIINPELDSDLMNEEIFGPILPVLSYESIEEAIEMINARPHPLAFYLFTKDKSLMKRFLRECHFGGGCINDTIMQVASDYLPFGGVGESGMGKYHGKASFDTFTHYRSIIKKANWLDVPIRYFPITDKKEKLIKKVLQQD